jgi:hypothetical protein
MVMSCLSVSSEVIKYVCFFVYVYKKQGGMLVNYNIVDIFCLKFQVSPLKSLLRDDLKRKIGNRSNSSIPARGRPSTASPRPESSFSLQPIATTTNGTITSTGPEQPSDSTGWRSPHKRSAPALQCVFCGIAFPDQTLYFLHKGCHSDSNPWKCNICGEQCSNVYEFNSHLLSKTHQ